MKEQKELNYDTETRLIVIFYEFLKPIIEKMRNFAG